MNIGETYRPFNLFVGSFIPNWLLRRSELSAGAKLTWARLAQYEGADGEARPGQNTLAEAIGVSERQEREYIRELEVNGLIQTTRRGLGRTNIYVFLWHEWQETSDLERRNPADQERLPSADQERRYSSAPLKESEENHLKRIIKKGEDGEWQALSTPPEFTEFHSILSDVQKNNKGTVYKPDKAFWAAIEARASQGVDVVMVAKDYAAKYPNYRYKQIGKSILSWLSNQAERLQNGRATNREAGTYLRRLTDADLERRGNIIRINTNTGEAIIPPGLRRVGN